MRKVLKFAPAVALVGFTLASAACSPSPQPTPEESAPPVHTIAPSEEEALEQFCAENMDAAWITDHIVSELESNKDSLAEWRLCLVWKDGANLDITVSPLQGLPLGGARTWQPNSRLPEQCELDSPDRLFSFVIRDDAIVRVRSVGCGMMPEADS